MVVVLRKLDGSLQSQLCFVGELKVGGHENVRGMENEDIAVGCEEDIYWVFETDSNCPAASGLTEKVVEPS